jgi:alpha-glucosidase
MHWWQKAVIYQIYPRSFQDSTGDGIGDLNGIRSRLDHLVSLGADTVWLSPINPSPMADFGYDVSNYTDDDFDQLIAEVHAKGLKLILDFVPNHSSDEHPWFIASRSSRDDAKRDWYIWRDPASDGGPPNNWLSHFGGSAWEWDEVTQQYYLHSFLKQQPDLNWRNAYVKAAMFDALRFWLKRGVDGFRVDVIWLLIKDALFRDNPPNPNWALGQTSRDKLLSIYDSDRPEIHDVIAEMRAVLDVFGDRLMIGEIYLPTEKLVTYYGIEGRGAQMPFNFLLINAVWCADNIASIIKGYEAALPHGAWPNWVLSNHDQSRIATRIGRAQARVAAMLLLTLRGTPTIYYGEELGMEDTPIPPDDVQDPAEKRQPGIGQGRDPERTPMLWDSSQNAGFSTGKPWLPLASDHAAINVAAERSDPTSALALYEALLRLRRERPILVDAPVVGLQAADSILRYERRSSSDILMVLLNLSAEPQQIDSCEGDVLLSTHLDRRGTLNGHSSMLRANEGIIAVRVNT